DAAERHPVLPGGHGGPAGADPAGARLARPRTAREPASTERDQRPSGSRSGHLAPAVLVEILQTDLPEMRAEAPEVRLPLRAQARPEPLADGPWRVRHHAEQVDLPQDERQHVGGEAVTGSVAHRGEQAPRLQAAQQPRQGVAADVVDRGGESRLLEPTPPIDRLAGRDDLGGAQRAKRYG